MRSKLSIIRVCCLRRESRSSSEGMVTWLKLMKLNFSSESTRRLALPPLSRLELQHSVQSSKVLNQKLALANEQELICILVSFLFSFRVEPPLRRPMRGAALIKIIWNNEQLLLLLLREVESQAITWHGSIKHDSKTMKSRRWKIVL